MKQLSSNICARYVNIEHKEKEDHPSNLRARYVNIEHKEKKGHPSKLRARYVNIVDGKMAGWRGVMPRKLRTASIPVRHFDS
ncbi:hypothetical protein AXF42_Ash000445 [Apostasia shenzhenica]|uniref:Uncharacterized protein n=1 Tax=Apostasia shenzhenica TaxID=1088818 RepID=A0A2I0AGE0_9ASPA|nr:hypothetical protein AXF42_Ash000445 [Apostasia shenzhenica]